MRSVPIFAVGNWTISFFHLLIITCSNPKQLKNIQSQVLHAWKLYGFESFVLPIVNLSFFRPSFLLHALLTILSTFVTTKHTNDDGLLHVLAYWLGKIDLFLTDKNITFVFDGFILISHLFGCYRNEHLISSYLLDKVLIKPHSKYFMLIVRSYTHYLFEKYCIIIFNILILISNE